MTHNPTGGIGPREGGLLEDMLNWGWTDGNPGDSTWAWTRGMYAVAAVAVLLLIPLAFYIRRTIRRATRD